jgi:glycosyltransferase involved in cell wall biosynthesis
MASRTAPDPHDRRVAVVVPSRNRPDLAARAVRTAKSQIGVTCEIVVVNDASHPEHRLGYEALAGDGVTVLHHELSTGACVARNEGARATRSPWIAFLDDDDRWAPDKLTAQLDAIATTPGAGWAGSGCLLVDVTDKVVGAVHPPESGDVSAEMLRSNAVPGGGSGVVVHRSLFERTGGFDDHLTAVQDWDFFTRLALESPAAFVDEPLVVYLMNTSSISTELAFPDPNLDYVTEKYASERAEHDVEVEPAFLEQWIADRRLRAGDAALATHVYANLFRTTHHPKWLARAALSRTAPKVLLRLSDAKGRHDTPAAWIAKSAWSGAH